MPDDRARPNALDRALDVALSELTTAAPPRGLRERVLARVAADDARRGRPAVPLRWTVVLPAAAAVGAMALAGIWLTHRTGSGTSPEASPSVAAAAPRPPAPAPAAQPPAGPPAPVAPRIARHARLGRPASAASGLTGRTTPVPAGGDAAPGLPPLEPPAALWTGDLSAVETRAPSPIEVPALRIEPLGHVEDGGSGLP